MTMPRAERELEEFISTRSRSVAGSGGAGVTPSGDMGIIIRLAITAVSLWIATLVIDGIELTTESVPGKIGTLLAVAAIFGVVNAVLRPIIKIVGCGLYVLTLGLIAIVVNGLLFMLTSWLAGQLDLPFHVDEFWPSAVLGALIVGVVSWVLNMVVPDGGDD
jgi:putative membrane protein